ncbi:hypothetical protein Q9L58_010841, partial [Maublancomyces gigas]
MQSPRSGDDFTGRMLAAINTMLLDMLAAVARKDYEDRRRRQEQGISKAKATDAYQGRPVNEDLHKRIKTALAAGLSLRATAKTEELKLKGLRRKIVGGLLAATGVIAVALTNYFVEHGELPIWLSKIVAWCIEFGAFAVPIPFWAVFTVLMICVVSLIGITYMYERQTRQNFAYTDELKTAYRELRSKCGSLEKSRDELEAACAALKESNSKLTQEV